MKNFFIYIYFWLVKWLLLKPMVKLSYIINGKSLGTVRWCQRKFNPSKGFNWNWLGVTAYKLSKYVMFNLK